MSGVLPVVGNREPTILKGPASERPPYSNADYVASTLSSLGKTAGVGLLRHLSFVVAKAHCLFHTYMRKEPLGAMTYSPPVFEPKDYDLCNSFELDECYERDASQLAEKLLDLLDDPTSTAFETITTSSLKRCSGITPDRVIGSIDLVFLRLLASPELIKHMHRLVEIEYDDKALATLNSEVEPEDLEAKSAYHLQKQYHELEKQTLAIWNRCFTIIESMFGEDLECLQLESSTLYRGQGKPVISLGHFLERLNSQFNWKSLTARSRFDPFMDAAIGVLAYLRDLEEVKTHPKVRELVIKTHGILSKVEVQNRLFSFVCDLEGEFAGSKKHK